MRPPTSRPPTSLGGKRSPGSASQVSCPCPQPLLGLTTASARQWSQRPSPLPGAAAGVGSRELTAEGLVVPAIRTPCHPSQHRMERVVRPSGGPHLGGHVWTRKVRKGGSPGKGLAEAGGRAAPRPPEVVVAPQQDRSRAGKPMALSGCWASRNSVLSTRCEHPGCLRSHTSLFLRETQRSRTPQWGETCGYPASSSAPPTLLPPFPQTKRAI